MSEKQELNALLKVENGLADLTSTVISLQKAIQHGIKIDLRADVILPLESLVAAVRNAEAKIQ